MNKESYILLQDEEYVYTFVSMGNQGVILKAIIFQKIETDVFNLVLADFDPKTNLLNDNSNSNNNDIPKIMATVYRSIQLFFESNSKAKVFIEGNSTSKTKLYNRILKNFHLEITEKYIVKGIDELGIENYVLGKTYKTFYIYLK